MVGQKKHKVMVGIIGVLYILSGIFCAINPEYAANYVGLSQLNQVGLAEFFTVYAGLQIGIGLAVLLSVYMANAFVSGYYFITIISTVLALFRIMSLVFHPIEVAQIQTFLVLEVSIALLLLFGLKHIK